MQDGAPTVDDPEVCVIWTFRVELSNEQWETLVPYVSRRVTEDDP